MSTVLTPVITSAGLQAVFNATNTGVQAEVTHIALGDISWEPDQTTTALNRERKRIPITGGERINPTQIHITAVEDGTAPQYWVREIGFYLSDGTLLAIWSNPGQTLAYKASGVDLLLAFDLVLTALPANSVTVDGTGGFTMPPATNSKEGIIRIATPAEANQGTRDDLAMTPKRVNDLYAHKNGDYSTLRARATTKADVGLGSVPNYSATSTVNDPATNKFATARAAKTAYDRGTQALNRANARALSWGAVQFTGYINGMDAVLNYTVPNGHVMVGLYSYHNNGTEDRQWRVRHRSITMV